MGGTQYCVYFVWVMVYMLCISVLQMLIIQCLLWFHEVSSLLSTNFTTKTLGKPILLNCVYCVCVMVYMLCILVLQMLIIQCFLWSYEFSALLSSNCTTKTLKKPNRSSDHLQGLPIDRKMNRAICLMTGFFDPPQVLISGTTENLGYINHHWLVVLWLHPRNQKPAIRERVPALSSKHIVEQLILQK